eukprot:1351671-Alexandrium_andersonii.AAC.1
MCIRDRHFTTAMNFKVLSGTAAELRRRGGLKGLHALALAMGPALRNASQSSLATSSSSESAGRKSSAVTLRPRFLIDP